MIDFPVTMPSVNWYYLFAITVIAFGGVPKGITSLIDLTRSTLRTLQGTMKAVTAPA